jgi:hypothetical protein
MIRNKSLSASLVFGLLVIGLSSCSKIATKSADEEIINKEIFLKVHARCGTADRASCVKKFFDLKVKDYCAEKQLSSLTPECKQVQAKVDAKVMEYFTDQVRDAFKGM